MDGSESPSGGPWTLSSLVGVSCEDRRGEARGGSPARPTTEPQQAASPANVFSLGTAAPPHLSNLPSKPQDSLHRTPSGGRSPDGGAPPTHPDSPPPPPPRDPEPILSPYTPPRLHGPCLPLRSRPPSPHSGPGTACCYGPPNPPYLAHLLAHRGPWAPPSEGARPSSGPGPSAQDLNPAPRTQSTSTTTPSLCLQRYLPLRTQPSSHFSRLRPAH